MAEWKQTFCILCDVNCGLEVATEGARSPGCEAIARTRARKATSARSRSACSGTATIINIGSVLGFLPGAVHGALLREQARDRRTFGIPRPRAPHEGHPGLRRRACVHED